MNLFRKRNDDEFNFDTDDFLIVFDDEKKTSDIKRVSEIKDGTVYVIGKYAVPLEDCEITTGEFGRNFFYRAPSQSIKETERLAKLEQSIVLRQITEYKPPYDNNGMDIQKWLLFGLVFLAFILFGLSSCSR